MFKNKGEKVLSGHITLFGSIRCVFEVTLFIENWTACDDVKTTYNSNAHDQIKKCITGT